MPSHRRPRRPAGASPANKNKKTHDNNNDDNLNSNSNSGSNNHSNTSNSNNDRGFARIEPLHPMMGDRGPTLEGDHIYIYIYI